MSDALRRIAPGLRKVGLDVDFVRHGRGRTRLIEIVRVDSSAADAADAVKRHFLDEEIDGLTESEERI